MSKPFIVVSSDGHAGANMRDYRPYLDAEFREEFDAFVIEWEDHGSRNFDLPALSNIMDPETVQQWKELMFDSGRIEGFPDPHRRLKEVEHEGISAEIIFPDFGIPFEIASRSLSATRGLTPPDAAHIRASYRCFNRWVADYVSVAPERFAVNGIVAWYDVDEAINDLHELKALGLPAVVLPEFSRERPLYMPAFEPIWNTISDLGLIVNTHSGFSCTSNEPVYPAHFPHPALFFRIFVPERMHFTQEILPHLVWGGVFERHPELTFVFTEAGTGWIPSVLTQLDYSYEHSYFRNDYKHVIRSKPSDYFKRQCYVGSSLIAADEIANRHVIGLDKMMIGMDYPHHEGTLIETTQEYLKAILGTNAVPEKEARMMLGETAAAVYGMDLDKLEAVAERIGPRPEEILVAPEVDLFPIGNVHRPAMATHE